MARTKQFNQQAVVDKAIAVFTAKGYHGTSAQDLVEALGLSRSSLYDTFGDKHGLFLHALQQYNRQSFGPVIELLTHTTDPLATLHQLCAEAVALNVRSGAQGGCLIVNSATELDALDAAVGTLVQQSVQAVEEAFATALDRGQQAGTVSPRHSARALARSLHTTLTGLRVMAKAGASQEAFEDVVRLALSLL